jgi:hypothetical protein
VAAGRRGYGEPPSGATRAPAARGGPVKILLIILVVVAVVAVLSMVKKRRA